MSLLPATERKKSWSYVVDLLGLRSFSNQRISGYSKGMRQRLGIAHALLNRPRLLLLDEPTDGLDPVGRRDVRDLLRATREEGCTMFINSHLLSEIEQLCDRVAILNSGKLVRIGTIDELTRSSGGYIVRISRSMIDSLPAMPAACSVQLLSNATEISVPNAQMLDQLVDLLRSHGVHIESIALERSTLEQAFIQIVTDRESPKEP
jgi:ABC-2 type transport system ATP-binding protein